MSFGFGKALDVLRDGDTVTRDRWRPTGTFGVQSSVQLMSQVVTPADDGDGARIMGAMFLLVTPGLDDVYLEPWAPTHADLLAEDWDYAR